MMTRMHAAIAAGLIVGIAGTASAGIEPTTVEFNFVGNAGIGLLPGNEVGGNTPGEGDSEAFGSENAAGLTFDTLSNTLSFDFVFSGLSGGLFNAASGIHFHTVSTGVDPFNETGPITFNLNSGTDPNVSLDTALVPIGSESGVITGSATLTESQVDDLFAGRIYLNIHSGDFNGGELRANLVQIPAPGAAAMLGLAGFAAFRRRR